MRIKQVNGSHLDLVDGGKHVRRHKLVGVNDEGGARHGRCTGLKVGRSSKDAVHRHQRQRGRDGDDHAGEGEHLWDVNNKRRQAVRRVGEECKKPTSGLEKCGDESEQGSGG